VLAEWKKLVFSVVKDKRTLVYCTRLEYLVPRALIGSAVSGFVRGASTDEGINIGGDEAEAEKSQDLLPGVHRAEKFQRLN